MEELCLQFVTLKLILENSTVPMGHLGPDLRGVVYALTSYDTPYEGKTKIGYTRSLIHRIPQIMKDIGGHVFVDGVIWTDDPPYLETRFHDLWADQKADVPRGHEWFDLTSEQVAWFRSLSTINTYMVKGYIDEPEDLIEWLTRPEAERGMW